MPTATVTPAADSLEHDIKHWIEDGVKGTLKDVALVAKPIPKDLAVVDGVGRELAAASGIHAIPFDVRIVNGASPVLLGEMLNHGRLLYESDRAARIEWEAAALSLWLDFKPVWQRVRKAALTRWARG